MAVKTETREVITCDVCGERETVIDNHAKTIKKTPCAVRTVKLLGRSGFKLDKANGYLEVAELDLCPKCKARAHLTVIGLTIDWLNKPVDYSFIEQEEEEWNLEF